jgi:hypothetical protein
MAKGRKMGGGRKKEIFNINFKKDLPSQLKEMSIKQLFSLLLSILLVIPRCAFEIPENIESVSSIFQYLGSAVSIELKKDIIEKNQVLGDKWEKAENASASKTFQEDAGPMVKNFVIGLSGGIRCDSGFCGNLIDSLAKIVKPDFISQVGLRDGILAHMASRSKVSYDYFSRPTAARPKYR